MRRSRLKVLNDILDAGKEPLSKTSIVSEANLNFKTCEEYLNVLEDNNMIETHRKSPKKYKTTEKGFDFLEDSRELVKLCRQ